MSSSSSSSHEADDWPTPAPTTLSPTSLAPTTLSPTTLSPTTITPTDNSTTAAPTAHPTTTPHHHHTKKQELEIDSGVIAGFVICVVLALMYRKRKRLPDYFLKLVSPILYYLFCRGWLGWQGYLLFNTCCSI